MFRTLLKFENTGVFEHCKVDSSWNREFKKVNIIYAGNGQGKTTISEIFDSLAKNDCEKVISRKRLGSTGKQEILFRTQTGEIKFVDGTWNTAIPNLFVFNSRFIRDNLYAGDIVQADQKRNLHSFVIGEEGVTLLKNIEALGRQIDEIKETEIASVEEIINAKKGNMPDIKSFVKLPDITDIDKKLHAAKSRLRDVEKIEEYLKAPTYDKIDFTPINVDSLKSLLSKNYIGITRQAEDKVKALLKSIKDKDASHWIIVGVNSIQNNKCPLCHNDVSDNDYIKLYKQFFSRSYIDFKKELAGSLEDALSRFNSVELYKMKSLINNNNRIYEYWKDIVDKLRKYESGYPRLLKNTDAFIERFKQCIDDKKSDILTSISLAKDIEDDINELNKFISYYNKFIEQESEKIDLWKKGLARENSVELRQKISMLETTKIRYSDEIRPLVDKLVIAENKIKKLQERRIEVKEALNTYIINFNKEFPKLINSVLESFGAGFTICEAKLDFRGGPKYEYQVNINGHSISLVNTDPNAPQLKNTLSDGDKTTLALAFFIAKIMMTNNKAECVIVIDDPISSLDIFRKGKTADYLYRISSEIEQIFVLTHNIIFGIEFYNRVKYENPVCLEIINGRIRKLDFQEKERLDYFVNYDILYDYINDQGKESEMSVSRAIRPILEGYLRFSYPKNFTQNKWLGDYIEDIRNGLTEPYNTLKKYLRDIEDFNAYYKKYHHTQGSVPAIDPIELKTYAKRVLEFCSLHGK